MTNEERIKIIDIEYKIISRSDEEIEIEYSVNVADMHTIPLPLTLYFYELDEYDTEAEILKYVEDEIEQDIENSVSWDANR